MIRGSRSSRAGFAPRSNNKRHLAAAHDTVGRRETPSTLQLCRGGIGRLSGREPVLMGKTRRVYCGEAAVRGRGCADVCA